MSLDMSKKNSNEIENILKEHKKFKRKFQSSKAIKEKWCIEYYALVFIQKYKNTNIHK